ncbi:hypothetical protein DIPPA_33401 [Diplonema papillatum]|nr:hypothetical protein DIPPA_33401 [Diplonema papillatum]
MLTRERAKLQGRAFGIHVTSSTMSSGSKKSKKKDAPVLEGEDRKEKVAVWMDGAGRTVMQKVPSGEGFSIAQLAQYSVLREKAAWREVRDEISGDVFFVQLPDMKTTRNIQHTPFKHAKPAGKLTRTTREAKLAKWETLVNKLPVSRHCTQASPSADCVVRDPRNSDNSCDAASWLTQERANASKVLLCPFTGQWVELELFQEQADHRKRAVAGLFHSNGIPLTDVIFDEVEVDASAPGQLEEFNRRSRLAFETLVANVVAWVIENEGVWGPRILRRQFDNLVRELSEEYNRVNGDASADSFSVNSFAPSFPKAADKVRQHPTDWVWGDTETNRQPGTVLHAFPVTGYVTVRWTTKCVGTYKWLTEIVLA